MTEGTIEGEAVALIVSGKGGKVNGHLGASIVSLNVSSGNTWVMGDIGVAAVSLVFLATARCSQGRPDLTLWRSGMRDPPFRSACQERRLSRCTGAGR